MEIRVPYLAEGVETGTVVSISVKVGDTVKKDQTVLEIETNKAVATIPAPEAGKIAKIHVKEGETIPVGGLLMTLATDGASGTESKPATASKSNVQAKIVPVVPAAPASTSQSTEGYQYVSKSGFPPPAAPSVRKLADQLGIDLARVRGSGNGGRITLDDVKRHIQSLQERARAPQPIAVGPSAPSKKSVPSIDFSKWGPVHKKTLTPLRKTIGDAMVDSWLTIPQVTQFDDIKMDALMKLRRKYVEEYKKKGVSLTVTSFVIKAVAKVLKNFPIFNSSLDENTNEIIFKEYYHIGLAVDTEHGLMVPVLRDADKKSLFEISAEIAQLAEKARTRKIAIEEMRGGTFTISNQGGIGGLHFTPIVNKPEVAILGLGRSFETTLVVDGKIKTQMVMPIGLSYDHRLIDGGQAARFVVALAEAFGSFMDKDAALAKAETKSKSAPEGKTPHKTGKKR